MVMREGVSAIECIRKMHAVGLETVRISEILLNQQQRLSSVEEAAEEFSDDLDALRDGLAAIDRDLSYIKGERSGEDRQGDRSPHSGLGPIILSGIFGVVAAGFGAFALFIFEHLPR